MHQIFLSENSIKFWTFNRIYEYLRVVQLRNVEIFCEVVNRRSFSKAAEVCQVAQSSASQAVNILEKRLGTQLIDRSKRPLELTASGQIYFEGCRKMLGSFQRVEDRIRQIKNEVIGRVRVAVIYSVGLLEMGSYIKRFRALYPDAQADLEYLHPDEVYARIFQDEADFGIVSFPREGGEVNCIPWQEQEMILVVPGNHRLADRHLLSWSDMQGEDYIGFTKELTIRKKVDRWLREEKVSVNVLHEFDNIENIKRAIEIGSGVALLPRPTVERETSNGALRGIRLKSKKRYRPLGIVHRRHRSLNVSATKLVELLHQKPRKQFQNGRRLFLNNEVQNADGNLPEHSRTAGEKKPTHTGRGNNR